MEGLCHKFAKSHSSNRPWGGRHVLLLGDPAQVPAVSRVDIFGTTLWRQFSVLLLHEVKRVEDPVLVSTLAKVRMGICDEEVNSTLLSRVCKKDWDTLHLNTTVVICSTCEECNEINEHSIGQVDGCSCEYIAVCCKNTWVTSTIFWYSQLHACCVSETLQTSRDASNLYQSVVEKLLHFVELGSLCGRPINQHFW